MIKIYDGRKHFFQWDLNQKLIIEDASVTEVHFCNKTDDCSLVCEVYEEDGLKLVNVPNILLQENWDIRAYAYCNNCYTKQYERFKVFARSKPADYVYTETEAKTWDALEQRVAALEEKGPGNVNLDNYYTKQEVEDLIPEAPDLSGYALKSEIPNVSSFVTMEQVEDKGYQTADEVTSAINSALGVIENGSY